jgi:hypothetical protein
VCVVCMREGECKRESVCERDRKRVCVSVRERERGMRDITEDCREEERINEEHIR